MREKVDPTRDHNAFRGDGASGRPQAVLADVCRALVENRSPLVTPDGPRWRLSDAGETLFRRRAFDARGRVRRLSA
ncbi:hypothetical protein ACO2Q1_09645 [Brevundimonas sp. VNH65]|uniref:hypothetical protein n=1 Tax=Brevundimonas sp. VNH65 TaxID=3400917 RepID=UPI003BFFAFD7